MSNEKQDPDPDQSESRIWICIRRIWICNTGIVNMLVQKHILPRFLNWYFPSPGYTPLLTVLTIVITLALFHLFDPFKLAWKHWVCISIGYIQFDNTREYNKGGTWVWTQIKNNSIWCKLAFSDIPGTFICSLLKIGKALQRLHLCVMMAGLLGGGRVVGNGVGGCGAESEHTETYRQIR